MSVPPLPPDAQAMVSYTPRARESRPASSRPRVVRPLVLSAGITAFIFSFLPWYGSVTIGTDNGSFLRWLPSSVSILIIPILLVCPRPLLGVFAYFLGLGDWANGWTGWGVPAVLSCLLAAVLVILPLRGRSLPGARTTEWLLTGQAWIITGLGALGAVST